MRRLALGVLVVSCGCNQIFGIRDTKEIDAALPDAAPVTGQIFLTWGVATPSTTGQPAASVALVPIGSEQLRPTPPMVQVGPIPKNDLPSHMLTGVTYDNSTGPAGGSFVVPQEFLGKPWRLVYQVPNDP